MIKATPLGRLLRVRAPLLEALALVRVQEQLAQADRGEFATNEEVRAIWAKHGL